MRVSILIAVTAGLLGCAEQSSQQPASAQGPASTTKPAHASFMGPPPAPPSDRAPVCARPQEKQAVAVSALVSELQVISILCHTEDQYNTLIPRLRPTLTANLKVLDGFFVRAYGARAVKMHDDYITELANLQSQLGLKSGDQFCALNAGMMDEVTALQGGDDLIVYASSKPIQQALAVTDCK
jgi:hypothetical protein